MIPEYSTEPGFVYLVEMEGQGLYKIGKSIDVQRRIAQFGVQPPFPYKLVYAHRVDNFSYKERHLHNMYGDYRLNGEWFRLTPEQLKLINRLLLVWQAEWLVDQLGHFFADVIHIASPIYLSKILRITLSAKRRVERRTWGHQEAGDEYKARTSLVPLHAYLPKQQN